MPKKQRDQSTDEDTSKPQKPKKEFEITITIWDDADISTKLVEFVKKDRGAPEKWLRKPDQFNAAIKAKISDNPALVLEKIAESLNIDLTTFLSAKARVTESKG